MNSAIAIRKTSDGRIQARRIDGKPLTVADREEAQRMALIEEIPPRAWVVEEVRDGGKLKAVKICSAVLGDHLWVVIDRNYQRIDGLAIYYPEEFTELSIKTPDQLREIHRAKLTFPGCRVIQEGAEKL
jgi:hypothetical protein